MKNTTLTTLLFLLALTANSQNIKEEKFGAIEAKDFIIPIMSKNNDDAAIILSNIGSTEFEGNNKGNFILS